ncbi:MAG: outer membrane protein transport protein [Desulfuromonadaceae bacterium]|nr:outer membrane protein transport protein [Desulfuromonadaceae bacterium]MDD5107200.1 outer membrane protein transport protein [Desulfuromonadaceae bacterium]
MNCRTAATGCFLLLLLFGVSTSGADEFHYTNILIGDRASGMGGAYTAVSDDASGMYYNPAGIAYATGRNVSASVNAFHVLSKTYKSVVPGQDWKRESSSLLPNFFGVMQPFGKFKIGFSYAVPDSNNEDQDQTFDLGGGNMYRINFNNTNNTHLFGPSVAYQVKDTVSVGATLYAHYRSTEAIANQAVLNTATRTLLQFDNKYTETDEWGIRPVFGVMWSPIDKVSFGVTAAKTFVISSRNMYQGMTSDPTVYMPLAVVDATNKRDYPWQFGVGGAWFPSKDLLISADVTCYSAVSYQSKRIDSTNTIVERTVNNESVVNGAIGAEYYLSEAWAVRGGLFTDFAITPAVTGKPEGEFEHVDLYCMSASLTRFSKNSSISLGGNVRIGSGDHNVAGQGKQGADVTSYTMFISSSYSF